MARIDDDIQVNKESFHLETLGAVDIFVVDMIEGFCKAGNMADASIMDITPAIEKVLQLYKEQGHEAYFFVDAHKEDAIEFKSFPKHCIENTEETKIVASLRPYASPTHIIYKNSTNGFHEIKDYLIKCKTGSIDAIIVMGCCTDICVMQFVLTLKTWLNAQNLDISVIVPLDGVDTYDSGNDFHPAPLYNAMALKIMQQAGITLCKHIEK